MTVRQTALSQNSDGKLVYFAIVHFTIKLLELPRILRIALYMTFFVFYIRVVIQVWWGMRGLTFENLVTP